MVGPFTSANPCARSRGALFLTSVLDLLARFLNAMPRFLDSVSRVGLDALRGVVAPAGEHEPG